MKNNYDLEKRKKKIITFVRGKKEKF
jgi:hypothetical protein